MDQLAGHGTTTAWLGVEYGRADGRGLLLDVLQPARRGCAPCPVVLYVHGGGWHEGDRGAGMHPWLNPLLARNGYVTASLTYRLSGEAGWPAPLDDVRTAVEWLRSHADEIGADPGRVGLWGHSAGAHLAALTALTLPLDRQVQAVAVSACPSDLREEVLDGGREVARLIGPGADRASLAAASPVCAARAGTPFLIAHGTHDEVVPFAQGKRLAHALGSVGCEVTWRPVENAGHDWADKPGGRGRQEVADTFGALVLPFFDRTLRRH